VAWSETFPYLIRPTFLKLGHYDGKIRTIFLELGIS